LCISEIQELGFINPSLQFVNCRDTCVPVIVNRKVDTTVLLFSGQFQESKILVSEAGSIRYRRYVSNVKRQKLCKPLQITSLSSTGIVAQPCGSQA